MTGTGSMYACSLLGRTRGDDTLALPCDTVGILCVSI